MRIWGRSPPLSRMRRKSSPEAAPPPRLNNRCSILDLLLPQGDLWPPLQTVNNVYFRPLHCKSLAEFRCPQTTEERQSVFSGGVYVGKHTPQAASVRPKGACDAAACILSKKCSHF